MESVNNLQLGNGKPWKQQYFINSTQNSDITGWSEGTLLPQTVALSQAIVTKNRVYLIGGHNGSTYLSTVYYATINDDGTLDSWNTGTPLPQPISNSQAIVAKNHVYLLGGVINGSYSSTVYYAPIDDDGTLGNWSEGPSLPEPVSDAQAIIIKNKVYLLGGYNDDNGCLSTSYCAQINDNGTLSNWSEGPSLPQQVHYFHAFVTKFGVYLLGGHCGRITFSSIYYAPINNNGDICNWIKCGLLPNSVISSHVFVNKNKVYLLGVYGGDYLSRVYNAPINTDGSIGNWNRSGRIDSWSEGTPLPQPVIDSQVIITKNYVYLLGGFNGDRCLSTTYYAPFLGGLNDYSDYYK